MVDSAIEIKSLIKDLNINKGDTVMLVSDVSSLLHLYKKKGKIFNINLFIDYIQEKIGLNGTLIIPTFNFDFCKGITFDYYNTLPHTGSLAKVAFKRKDFKRTRNPIHSFVVSGKDKENLLNLKHASSFGIDSPFFYLHKNCAKYLSVGLDFTNLGFTPAHYVEEQVGVTYRYFKNFSGTYINEDRSKKEVEYTFYVRDTLKTQATAIKKETTNFLSEIKACQKYVVQNEIFEIIELGKALDFLIDDMKNNSENNRLIYPVKKDAKIERSKINKVGIRE